MTNATPHEHLGWEQLTLFMDRMVLAACGADSHASAAGLSAMYLELPDCGLCRGRVTIGLAHRAAERLQHAMGAEGAETWLMNRILAGIDSGAGQ